MPYYFAYGSNINLPALDEWCREQDLGGIRVIWYEPAVLSGWRLTFDYMSGRWRGAAPNIEPAEGHSVEGVLYELPKPEFAKLDLKETNYGRIKVPVKMADDPLIPGEIEALTYRVLEEHRSPKQHFPRALYMRTIIDGATLSGLSSEYIYRLQQINTRP